MRYEILREPPMRQPCQHASERWLERVEAMLRRRAGRRDRAGGSETEKERERASAVWYGV